MELDSAISIGRDSTTTLSAREGPDSRRLPYTILPISLSGLFLIQIMSIAQLVTVSHPSWLTTALASATATFALQLGISSPDAERWSASQRGAAIAGQVILTYLPLLAFGIMWTGMTGFLAGSVLLLLPNWKAWALFAAIALSVSGAAIMMRVGGYGIAVTAVCDPAVGILVFALSRLALLVRHAHAMHQEIAQLAAIRERSRFARDLHDLLSYSLSAISLKAELGRRIMESKPDLAREELADVVVFARQAVADVRLVANGYRTMSLSAEAGSAASLLTAAGIIGDIEIVCGSLDARVDTVLATILREAVTNLLRHSSARTCRIAASRSESLVKLIVTNDGVPQSAAIHREGGGLENMTARVESVGGTLTVDLQDGIFFILATVPHAAHRLPDPSAAVECERTDG